MIKSQLVSFCLRWPVYYSMRRPSPAVAASLRAILQASGLVKVNAHANHPRGRLRVFLLLYLSAAPLGLAAALLTKDFGYAAGGIVFGGLAFGIWKRSRICACIFLFLLGGQCLVALPLLVRDGRFDWLRCLGILVAGYSVFLVGGWLSRYSMEERSVKPSVPPPGGQAEPLAQSNSEGEPPSVS